MPKSRTAGGGLAAENIHSELAEAVAPIAFYWLKMRPRAKRRNHIVKKITLSKSNPWVENPALAKEKDSNVHEQNIHLGMVSFAETNGLLSIALCFINEIFNLASSDPIPNVINHYRQDG